MRIGDMRQKMAWSRYPFDITHQFYPALRTAMGWNSAARDA